jgi:hypothetical protein
MDNQQGTLAVTDFEVGWLAGIIDGEGTIAFSVYALRHNGKILQDVRVKPQIIVTNTDKDLVEKVADIFGRRRIGVHFQTRTQHGRSFAGNKPSKYRPLHVANISGFLRAKKALEFIGPHLVSKKAKADLVLRYIVQRELKRSENKNAAIDEQDIRLIRDILLFSMENSVKGAKTKHLPWIEGLLNEHEQRRGRKAA